MKHIERTENNSRARNIKIQKLGALTPKSPNYATPICTILKKGGRNSASENPKKIQDLKINVFVKYSLPTGREDFKL